MALVFVLMAVTANDIAAVYGSTLFTCGYQIAIASDYVPYPPPYTIDLSPRHPALDVKVQHVIHSLVSRTGSLHSQSGKQEGLQLSARLFDSQTNETLKDVTYTVAITRIEDHKNGNNTVGKEAQMLGDSFRSRTGILRLDVWSSASANYTSIQGNAIENPFLWIADEQGNVRVDSSELLVPGKYHAHVEVMGIKECVNFDKDRTPKLDKYWTITLNENNHLIVSQG